MGGSLSKVEFVTINHLHIFILWTSQKQELLTLSKKTATLPKNYVTADSKSLYPSLVLMTDSHYVVGKQGQ